MVEHIHIRPSVITMALGAISMRKHKSFIPIIIASKIVRWTVMYMKLVVMSIVDSEGRRLLGQVPMTFRDSTGRIGSYWQQLYSRHGMRVPEGAPGSNPSELAQRKGVIIKKLKR